VASSVPVQLAPDCRTFYDRLSSPQTRYCSQPVTAVPNPVLQHLVTTGYYPTCKPQEHLHGWHAEGHPPAPAEIGLSTVGTVVWHFSSGRPVFC